MTVRVDFQSNINTFVPEVQRGLRQLETALQRSAASITGVAQAEAAALSGLLNQFASVGVGFARQTEQLIQRVSSGIAAASAQGGGAIPGGQVNLAEQTRETFRQQAGIARQQAVIAAQGATPEVRRIIAQQLDDFLINLAAQARTTFSGAAERITSERQAATGRVTGAVGAGQRSLTEEQLLADVTRESEAFRNSLLEREQAERRAAAATRQSAQQSRETAQSSERLDRAQESTVAAYERVKAQIAANLSGGSVAGGTARQINENLFRDAEGEFFQRPVDVDPETGAQTRRRGELERVRIEQLTLDELEEILVLARIEKADNARINRILKQRSIRQQQILAEEVAQRAQAGELRRVSAGLFVDPATGGAFEFTKGGVGTPARARRLSPEVAADQLQIKKAYDLLEKQIAAEAAASARRTATSGGGRGRGGPPTVAGALFDPEGPDGRGGLFTRRRLLQQGVSFGGYVIAAAAIGSLLTVVTDTFQETLKLQDALTDLNVAFGEGAAPTQSFTNDLQEVAVLAGENVSTAMETAARGIRAFGRGIEDAGERARVGFELAEQANQLAVIAAKGLEDATGDLIASARGFSIGAEGLSQINDAVAIAKQELGGDPDDIAQGLAGAAQIAAEAGFTLQETASIISAVSATTDASASKAASGLTRLLSTLGGTTGRSTIQAVNAALPDEEQIDPQGSLRDQLFGLGAAYSQLSEEQQGLIQNQIGGRTSARELIAIFENLEGIFESTERAAEGAGQGQEEFERRLDSLAGTVRIIGGELTAIQNQLVEAGIFDIFGIALEAAEPFLGILREVLSIYNQLPRSLRTIIALTLEYLAVSRLLAATGAGAAISGLFGRAAGAAGGAAAGGAAAGATAAASGLSGVGAAGGAAVVGAGGFFTRALTGLAAFATSTAGAVTAVGAVVVAFNELQEASDKLSDAQERVASVAGVESASRTDLIGAAEASQAAADELRRASSGFFGTIAAALDSRDEAAIADSADERAEFLRRRLDEGEEARRDEATGRDVSQFFRLGAVDGVSGGLELLEATGRDAETQLLALAGALEQVNEGVPDTLSISQVADTITIASDNASQALNALVASVTGEFAPYDPTDPNQSPLNPRVLVDTGGFSPAFTGRTSQGIPLGPPIEGDQRLEVAEQIAELSGIFTPQLIEEELERALAGGEVLDQGEIRTVAENIVTDLARDYEVLDELPAQVRDFIESQLAGEIRAGQQRVLDESVVDALAQELVSGASSAVELAQGVVAKYQTLAEATGETEVADGVRVAQDSLDRVFAALEANEDISDAELEQFRIDFAQATIDLREAMFSDIDRKLALANTLAEAAGTNDVEEFSRQLEAVRAKIAELEGTTTPNRELLGQLRAEETILQRQRAEAEIQLNAGRQRAQLPLDDTVGRANVDLEEAERLLALTNENEQAYADRVEAVKEARQAVAEAISDNAVQALLGINDPDNELAAAFADYLAARAAIDRATAGTAAYYSASFALNDALKELARYNRGQAIELARQADALAREAQLANVNPADRKFFGAPGAQQDSIADQLIEDLENAPSGSLPQPVRPRAGSVDSGGDPVQDALRRRQAIREAGLVPGSPLAAARVELANAEDALSVAERNTTEYYQALAKVREAQFSLAEAQAEVRTNKALLARDFTDPLQVAQAEVTAAREKLERDRARGADESVLVDDELALARAIADAEQSYFNQQLQLLRTNLDLGRITRAQYIAELELLASELRAIEDRTFQQQQLLDQIDLAIQGANQALQGQFNLGEIDVPTPFEARRAVEEQLAASNVIAQTSGGTLINDQRIIEININGGNIEEVRRELRRVLGSPDSVSATLSGTRL